MRFLTLTLIALVSHLSLMAQSDTLDDDVIDFSPVESLPIAPGCDSLSEASNEAYKKCLDSYIFEHIGKHFRFPEIASRRKVGARIFVYFVIEKNGKVKNVEIKRGALDLYKGKSRKKRKAARALDKEVIRVIKMLEFEKPAIQRGEPVRMNFTLPVNAKL